MFEIPRKLHKPLMNYLNKIGGWEFKTGWNDKEFDNFKKGNLSISNSFHGWSLYDPSNYYACPCGCHVIIDHYTSRRFESIEDLNEILDFPVKMGPPPSIVEYKKVLDKEGYLYIHDYKWCSGGHNNENHSVLTRCPHCNKKWIETTSGYCFHTFGPISSSHNGCVIEGETYITRLDYMRLCLYYPDVPKQDHPFDLKEFKKKLEEHSKKLAVQQAKITTSDAELRAKTQTTCPCEACIAGRSLTSGESSESYRARTYEVPRLHKQVLGLTNTIALIEKYMAS